MKLYNNIDLLSTPTEEQHVINKKTLDDEINKVKARLNLTIPNTIVCIIDDDGTTRTSDSYTGMTTWLNNQNIPMDFAICHDTIGTSGKYTVDQLKTLQQNGNGIISHGMTKLQDMADTDAIDTELQNAKDFCVTNGFTGGNKIYVYPEGLNDDGTVTMEDAKKEVGKYFEYALNVNIKANSKEYTKGLWNEVPLVDKLDMARMEISDTKGLTLHKANIDNVIENKGLLLLFTHSFRSGFVGTSAGNYQDGQGYINFKEVIEYLKTKDVEFMTVEKALQTIEEATTSAYVSKSDVVDVTETATSEQVANAKSVFDSLWEDKTRTVVDIVEHYELSTDSTGLTIVDDSATPSDTEIKLSDVQAKVLSTDTHTYAVGEIVILVPETSHTETYKESIYLPRSEAPESATFMTVSEFDDMWGEVIILDYEQS